MDQAVPAQPQEFLTVDEAAELLRINKHTLYEAIKTGELPWAKHIGRIVRISRAGMLGWFERGGELPKKKRRIT